MVQYHLILEVLKAIIFGFKGGNLPFNYLKMTMTNFLNSIQVIGTCFSVSKEIKILESYWNGASESQKRLLIYHELAHCYLNRPHKIKLVNGVHVSIMYSSSLHWPNFRAFELMYIEELFINDSTNIERTLASYSSSFPQILESKTDTYHYKCAIFTIAVFILNKLNYKTSKY